MGIATGGLDLAAVEPNPDEHSVVQRPELIDRLRQDPARDPSVQREPDGTNHQDWQARHSGASACAICNCHDSHCRLRLFANEAMSVIRKASSWDVGWRLHYRDWPASSIIWRMQNPYRIDMP